jgi:K+-transporting ATPase ATPase C chain
VLAQLRPALVLLVLFTVLTGLAYPLAITGVAQVAFPGAANGSLVQRDGKVVGSLLIGQNFADDRYFQGRPSATSGPDPENADKTVDAPYNAAASTGSNLGPTSKALAERVAGALDALKPAAGAAGVPADAVTTSASGLDPDVSPANALMQVARVAAARKKPAAEIRALVERHVEGRTLGLLGEPRVNVLRLNLALDAAGR